MKTQTGAGWLVGSLMLVWGLGCGPTLREAIRSGHVVNARNSVVGIDLAPMGHSPESPRVSLGSSVTQFSVVPSAPDQNGLVNSPPVLNRTDVKAPGVRVVDTVGVGNVGDQFNEHVVDAIEALHSNPSETDLEPTPVPAAQ